ncbi:ferredoxin [Rhodococcus koreensis]|uniref:Ferredoxin n=1 Tax=Rhodococcus koreensis TaxID=99653 RepID=A0A1H4L1H0_9NOCA|nr:ferredoxin [Rhodococcus koreensis]SEB64587.1 ferredoxin [Rhodococcus koreensis]
MAENEALFIDLDTSRCTSLGICEALAPKHFEVQDDGSVTVDGEPVSDEDIADVRNAVTSCPTEALKLITK